MGIGIDNSSRQTLIFASLACMLLGLFLSRSLLSTGLIFFIFLTCFHPRILDQVTALGRAPLLGGMVLLFLIPFFSGLWSTDTTEWLKWLRVKLPLLFLPLAFAGNWQLSPKQWRQLAGLFLLLVLAGVLWSGWQYFQHAGSLQADYLRAKTLPVPLENDHVRFSWMVCMGVVIAVCGVENLTSPLARAGLAGLAVLLSVYLHVLSARTGLLCLYVFGGMLVIRWLWTRKKGGGVFLVLMVLAGLPLLAWFFFPTFQNRIRYNLYDLSFVRKEQYLPGGNDGNRILSLRAGWDILKENPWGVGAGDVMHTTRRWYALHVPGMEGADQIYPSSEWLLYGDAAGWAGVLLFTLIVLLPLFEKRRKSFFGKTVVLLGALSFLWDVGLEVQFGVFLYGLLVLCWWKAEGYAELPRGSAIQKRSARVQKRV
ncbi:MAG: O-antigen ligase family protein [Flavisolibacter sp.]